MPLGKRSTALEAVQGHDLKGTVAVVTGGNSGIGAQTVRALAHAGARVILTSRDLAAGGAVAERLRSADGDLQGSIEVKQLDLADLVSVNRLAGELQQEPRLDTLVLNAGVMMCPRGFTKDGFEMQWGTNHVGHQALTTALLPKLKAQTTPSRIVVLSSSAHLFQRKPIDWDDLDFSRRQYSPRGAYGQSKLANVYFAKQLAAELKGSPVQAYCVHPGIVETPLWRHMGMLGGCISFLSRTPFFGVKSAEQGAATSVYAATAAELDGHSGVYLADCAEVAPSKLAQDAEQARKCWDITQAAIAKAHTTRDSLKQAKAAQ